MSKVEFSENESMRVMPRLYEHINRVDLWVMAQKDQWTRDRAEIERLKAESDRDLARIHLQSQTMAEQEREIEALRGEVERLKAISLGSFDVSVPSDEWYDVVKFVRRVADSVPTEGTEHWELQSMACDLLRTAASALSRTGGKDE